MDFFDTVMARYSYRGEFEATPVPKDDLVKIVTAGIHAPSAGNMQSQSFYIVTNAELRGKIAALMSHPGLNTAPALILLVSRGGEGFGAAFELQDYGAAAENVLLAAAALGYVSLWTDGMTNFSEPLQAGLRELFPLEEHQKIRAILPIGVPKEKGGKQPPRKPFNELVKIYE